MAVKIKWTYEKIRVEALKYNSRSEFKRKNRYVYALACKMGILDKICSHMKTIRSKNWNNLENLKKEALKYNNKIDFIKNSPEAYKAAWRRGVLDEICSHMNTLWEKKWGDKEKIKLEALKYSRRSDFKKNSSGAYHAAKVLGILDEVCFHMKKSSNSSKPEYYLLNDIKLIFPKACKLKDRKVKIIDKSYIEHLEIDIYIPELRKGIEFDGKYWHSDKGLKRGHPTWPDEDIRNYHEIKDAYFLSKGIEILHIKEEDWLENKEICIQKCLDFLNNRKLGKLVA
jgi:hypothetical protein